MNHSFSAMLGAGQYFLSDTQTKIRFDTVLENPSPGRFDTVNHCWRPVLEGEAARPVILCARAWITGGLRNSASGPWPMIQAKILRNVGTGPGGFGYAAAAIGMPDQSRPGMGSCEGSYRFWAEPGDWFEVHLTATAANSAQPFPSLGGLGSLQLDTHPAHTWFWGVTIDGPEVAALQAQLATLQSAMADLQARVEALENP